MDEARFDFRSTDRAPQGRHAKYWVRETLSEMRVVGCLGPPQSSVQMKEHGMAYAQVEIDPESVADAMNEDANFPWHMLRVIAEHTDMGPMADKAADIGRELAPDQAEFVSRQFAPKQASEALRSACI